MLFFGGLYSCFRTTVSFLVLPKTLVTAFVFKAFFLHCFCFLHVAFFFLFGLFFIFHVRGILIWLEALGYLLMIKSRKLKLWLEFLQMCLSLLAVSVTVVSSLKSFVGELSGLIYLVFLIFLFIFLLNFKIYIVACTVVSYYNALPLNNFCCWIGHL